MDKSSADVAAFLTELQSAQERLGDVWQHFAKRGVTPSRPSLVISGKGFQVHKATSTQTYAGSIAIGLNVIGTDNREYDLGIDVMWDDYTWTIATEAWASTEQSGQVLLRELPPRLASDLEGCRAQMRAAINDLMSFDDIVK